MAHRYSGLVEVERLAWAVGMLTEGACGRPDLDVVHHGRTGVLASGDQALGLVRRHHRRHLVARVFFLADGRPEPASQPSFGRQRLATAFARLPYRARVAVVMVDGCGLPELDVAAGLGWTTGRVRRALARGRRELAASVATSPAQAVAIAPELGAALRAVRPLAPARWATSPFGAPNGPIEAFRALG